jgi:hypothetical protein
MRTPAVRNLVIATLSMILGSCGSDRKFNNPDDPDNTKTGTTGGQNEPADDETTNPDASAPQCLTSACSPPSGSVYNFSKSFAVGATGCSNIQKVRTFDTSTGLIIFFSANCGTRNHVYSTLSDYAGNGQTTPVLLSTDCNSGSTGVKSYTIDKGTTGFLMAYECNPSSGSYTTRIVAINSGGSPTAVSTYESLTTSKTYIMAWNATASTFGLARAGQFQRYNESAVAVGGPIATNSQTLYQNFVSGGSWYIINSIYNALCSKVSAAGSLLCNGITMTGTSRPGGAVSSTFVNDSSSSSFNTYTINTTNCTATIDADLMKTSNSIIGSFGALQVSTNISAYLFKSPNSLIFTTFTPTQIYSENAVAGYTTSMGDAEAKVINTKVYVSYDKDGTGFVSYSAESVP